MTHCFKLAAVFVLLSSIAFGQSPGQDPHLLHRSR